jgi:hypothetical protein
VVLPHGGLTDCVPSGSGQLGGSTKNIVLASLRVIVNMAVKFSEQFESGHVGQNRSTGLSPGFCSAGHSIRIGIRRCIHRSSTFLRSLGSTGVTPLPRYYERSDSCVAVLRTRVTGRAGITAHEHRPVHTGLLASRDRIFRPFRLQPPDVVKGNASGLVALPYRTTQGAVAVSPRPRRVIWASPLASWLATTPGRIEFVILRTSRSPPVALHPASRRRSYVRLQSSDKLWRGLAPRWFDPITSALAAALVAALILNWTRILSVVLLSWICDHSLALIYRNRLSTAPPFGTMARHRSVESGRVGADQKGR